MNDDWSLEQEGEATEEAVLIVAAARRRALGARRTVRRLGAVLWASFLGATASLVCVLLLPAEGWLPLNTPARAALAFALLWGLALIPAVIAAILATSMRRGGQHGAQ